MSTFTMSIVSIEDRSLPLRQHISNRLGEFQADCDRQITELRDALAARIDELLDRLADELIQIQQQPPLKSEPDEEQQQQPQPQSEPDETRSVAVDYDNVVEYVGCSDDDMLFDDADDDDEEMSDGEEEVTSVADAAAASNMTELQSGDGESSAPAFESECIATEDDDAADRPPARRRRASVDRRPAIHKTVYQCEICAYIVYDRYTLQLHQLSAHGQSARFVFVLGLKVN